MKHLTTGGRKSGWRNLTRLTTLFCLTALFAPLSPALPVTAQVIAATKQYEPASVAAMPGLQCELHPPGTPAAQGIPVATNSDGYARFYAVKVGNGGAGQWLTLSCTNSAGKAFSYPVNLASAATFAPRPLALAAQPGKNRPPLTGDPMRFTQAQLVQLGYGLRPDARTAPAAFERWLAAARVDGRMLTAKEPDLHSHTATSQSGGPWAGTAITGAPTYAAVEGTFNVPTAIPGGDQTSTTEVAIWDGLGGFGTGSGLIQSGASLYTTSNAAEYGTWREYCCGDPHSNGYGGNFSPNPGDEIYAENWYCDAQGNVDVSGGYGCSFLEDLRSGAILNCTAANGSPCWSVPAIAGMTFGPAAEFVIEDQSPQVSSTSTAFTDFSPAVTMAGSAYSTRTNSFSQSIGNDPSLHVLTDFTNTTSHIVVSTTAAPASVFTMEATQPSYPLYCQGPLSTSTAQVPTPTTVFNWASTGAGAAPPGPGQCAWADRPPRGVEEHSGGTGIIFGYLNQVANLPTGQYSEIGVYRDPGFGNDLSVTQIVGLVSPPFSPRPVLP
ncbi:MAG TPA: G1 family glutamic endopeptidase [Acidimicrobiales bacterium]|nr:G1 family glutamic endopeptidase [Acidimicrobiales bacterium]